MDDALEKPGGLNHVSRACGYKNLADESCNDAIARCERQRNSPVGHQTICRLACVQVEPGDFALSG
ncbi:hypothetical protein OBV_11290 [Oscillibacter valericigenes Sjm18-20]|nr:hypothetical protein OBV_11290 [Oscillibacter valericigenes Sjm18-20]